MTTTIPVNIPGFGIVMVTYNADGDVISVTSNVPLFVFLFGPEVAINIDAGMAALIQQIQVILFILGLGPEPDAATMRAVKAR